MNRSAIALSIFAWCSATGQAEPEPYAPFAEPGYPWLASVVDASEADVTNKGTNLAVRGIVLRLGSGMHACFDTDLLRLSAAWQAADDSRFIEMNGVATQSYQRPFDKAGGGQEKLPKIRCQSGQFLFGNALEAGWSVPNDDGSLEFGDPRPPTPDADEPGG
jgi:hypothetical protein